MAPNVWFWTLCTREWDVTSDGFVYRPNDCKEGNTSQSSGSRTIRLNEGKAPKRLAMRTKPRAAKKAFHHSGSSFDSFLEDEGIREEAEAVAIKRVLAWQLEQAMR